MQACLEDNTTEVENLLKEGVHVDAIDSVSFLLLRFSIKENIA